MIEITLHDLLTQEAKSFPHAFYAELRSTAPLIYIEGLDAWVVTTYEDALWLFKDPRFTKDRRKLSEAEEHRDETWGTFDLRTLLMVDPPDHTRLRHLVSKAFTPRMIEHQRPHIQQITDDLLDAIQAHGADGSHHRFCLPIAAHRDL